MVPFGMEEGTGYEFTDRKFLLRVGKAAQFRFFQSSERAGDAAGALIEEIAGMDELAPVEAQLPSEVQENVAVTLASAVTETGCCSCGSWRGMGGGGSWSSM